MSAPCKTCPHDRAEHFKHVEHVDGERIITHHACMMSRCDCAAYTDPNAPAVPPPPQATPRLPADDLDWDPSTDTWPQFPAYPKTWP